MRLPTKTTLLLTAAVLGPGCGAPQSSAASGTQDATATGTGTGDETGAGSDETGEIPTPACDELDVGSSTLRRLTREQYQNAVRDLLGVQADVSVLEVDEKVGPFDSNLTAPASAGTVLQYRVLAESVAEQAAERARELVPCPGGSQTACLRKFTEDFGRRAYRRPLTEEELVAYLTLSSSKTELSERLRLIVGVMLQSPHFLYHVELGLPEQGTTVVPLDAYELASRLSFFLWNSVPDDTVLDAAAAGSLQDASGLRTQAERMLADPRARSAIASFHRQWLGLDDLELLTKDPALHPDFDAAVRQAMWDETRRFTEAVVLEGDGGLQTLLTASWSYLEGPMFALYGLTEPADHDVATPVDLPEAQRSGVLTHPSFLAVHAHADQSGPVQRGAAIRNHFLCDPPPPPPPGVNAIPPEPDPEATTREIFEQHTSDPQCAGCHSLIDGIGLGFEHYDEVGAYRDVQNGSSVDAGGELLGTDVDGSFEGAIELVQALANSTQVRECVAVQWFRFAFGRPESEGDACSLQVLDAAFEASDGSIRELLLTIVQTDSFRYRSP